MFLRDQVLFDCRQNIEIKFLSLQNSKIGLENSLRAKSCASTLFFIFEIKSEPVSFLVYLKPQCRVWLVRFWLVRFGLARLVKFGLV